MKVVFLLLVPSLLLAQPPRGQRPMGPPPPMVHMEHPRPERLYGHPHRRHMVMQHRMQLSRQLTDTQKKQLFQLRQEYIQKRNAILKLKNP